MKKLYLQLAALFLAMLCLLCGCSAKDFALPAQISLSVGQQCSLPGELRFTGNLADVTPEDRAQFAQAVETAVIHMASTKPEIAAADETTGLVTALSPGTAVVLVSCSALDFYAEVTVQVVPAGATPETATPETATPETATPETATPETATPETAAVPKVETPETATPETATPETATPETATPESVTPETATPETATPETATPETATPETATPEAATPESATPETATPETATPETATGRAWYDPLRDFLQQAGQRIGTFFRSLPWAGKQ